MTDRPLRARLLLEEAHALGLDLADLIAADIVGGARIPTVRAYVEAIAATFTPGAAATYRPYWRLAVERLGDRRLVEVTIEDLAVVVDAAAARAQRRRPDSTPRGKAASPRSGPCSAVLWPPGSSPPTPPPRS